MKLKIFIYSFIILFFFSETSTAQIIYTNDNEKNEQSYEDESVNTEKSLTDNKNSKVNYELNIGSSFSSSSFGNAVTLYTAPAIRYKLAPKLSLKTGFLLTNSTVSDYYFAEKDKRYNYTQSYIFSSIDYQATQKLRISGEILYGMNKSPFIEKNSRNSEYFLRFNAEYKITDNFSIGLQVINQNMGYPTFRNTFGNSPFNNYYSNPYYPFTRF